MGRRPDRLVIAGAQAAQDFHFEIVVTLAQRRQPLAAKFGFAAARGVDLCSGDIRPFGRHGDIRGFSQLFQKKSFCICLKQLCAS